MKRTGWVEGDRERLDVEEKTDDEGEDDNADFETQQSKQAERRNKLRAGVGQIDKAGLQEFVTCRAESVWATDISLGGKGARWAYSENEIVLPLGNLLAWPGTASRTPQELN